ncbi:DUF1801 domain-containing protein [uncultured Flavobacterium sp.]|uniref:iron chaperone n=1 Tax=uncultured Flavobacterium sp. TaxID=165435 RepID=UPI0025F53FCA|nr:DUF1801 domain-containing protein [uncultured Flavobacterium sp.]
MNKPKNIDEYIAAFPPEIQKTLGEVRQIIRNAAPEATEKISYALPTFYLHGNLVHFGAFTNHIGLYALPSGNKAFQDEISRYQTGKGSIQFPLSEPMPHDLIQKIVNFRVAENNEKAMLKNKK